MLGLFGLLLYAATSGLLEAIISVLMRTLDGFF